MANNVENVAVGKPRIGGGIYRAPLGTPVPLDASTPLSSAFIHQGYVSDEGVAREISRSRTALKAWGGDEVANVKTEETIRLNFGLIESGNVEALKSAYGAGAVSVAPNGEVTIAYDGGDGEPGVWVVELEYRGRYRRIIFPRTANVTEDFSQTFSDEELITLPFSIAAYRDDNGHYFYDRYQGEVTGETTAQVTVTATGGTYTLSVNGFSTPPIAHDANAGAITSAVNGLSGVTGVTVTTTGTTDKTLTFSAPVVVTGDGSGLTGPDAGLVVTQP